MADRRQVLDALLRVDLASFIAKSFETLNPGAAYQPNWHIRAIAFRLEECLHGRCKRLIVTLPPRNLKSTCVSVAFPAWVLGHEPARRILCVSYSDDLALQHSRDCRTVMESRWYRRLFPATRSNPRKNTERELVTQDQGFRLAVSVGGSLTGRGGNLIIIDDPLKAQDATSSAERGRVNAWYDGTLYTRLDDKAEDTIVLVMHRLHADDLVGHVLEKEDWAILDLPAIATEGEEVEIGAGEHHRRRPQEVLHPARENRETLERIRRTVGSACFEAQYQQCPVPPQGNLIRREWFQRYRQPPAPGAFRQIVQSWDPSVKAGLANDYSVCTTWGLKGGDYYLLHVYRERLEFPTLLRTVSRQAQEFSARVVLIEDAGTGAALIQTLRQEGRLKVIPVRPKLDKETRVSQCSATIEAGRVYLPEEAPWLAAFERELLAFPNGRHDDQVDSLSQFLGWASGPRYEWDVF